MLFAKNTPNHSGVAIYGDANDFENLYEALHIVVGDEDEEELWNYYSARIRVLGLCYDIRHALMGDREYEFVDNGLDSERKKRLSLLASDKNVYLKIHVLWPEMLFIMIALNRFVALYAIQKSKAKHSHNLFAEPKVCWDSTIANIRMLQVAVAECIEQTIPAGAYARMLNTMNGRLVFTAGYITQYIDVLNHRFINMNSEKRLKNISIFAKRIVEQGDEYGEIEAEITEEATRRNCHVTELRLAIEYPEQIDW